MAACRGGHSGRRDGLLVLWASAQEYLWRALWDSSRFGPNDIPGKQSVRGMLLRSPLDDHTAQPLGEGLTARTSR